MIFKIIQFVLFIVFILILVTACSNNENTMSNSNTDNKEEQISNTTNTDEVITLMVGHVAPESHSYHLGLLEYAEAVDEETNGQVQIEIYSGGQIGGEREMVEQVTLGSLDMVLSTSGPVGNFIENFAVIEMPFIYRDLDHAYSVLDGEIGQDLLSELSEINVKGLSFFEKGYSHFSNDSHDINSPDDMVGLKMRTMENEVYIDMYEALGADPVPIAWPEVYTSVQQGIVNGVDNTIGALESTNIYEIQESISLAGLYYSSAVLMINQNVFEGLSNDHQEALVKAGNDVTPIQREINQGLEEEQLATMEEFGVNIIRPEEIDLKAFQDAAEVVYNKYNNRFDDYIERIQNEE
ncbi:TRAP transporter substrate-binding protein DctP [Salipaludibacillus sp. CF4.18]|uniref:TRAP transporter substrate-binding protein DctP n=1 Tax=Salipaludibacillus sp. CF4.18 TaxID=3373081 RepID=UPI003EE78C67